MKSTAMGGGVMRTAAKVAGIGAGNRGVRGLPNLPPAEQSVRNASGPVSAIMSSSQLQNCKAAIGSEVETVQRPAWEIDDWEFAGFEDGVVIEAGKPLPRVVFGAVPSFDEAKEATTELKEALDKVYLSSPKLNESDGSISSGLSLYPKAESETGSSIIETSPNALVPKHALQAFKLLQDSPQTQTVVASIASDPNVWNAMLGNPVLKDFIQSHQTKSVQVEESPKKFKDAVDVSQTENSENVFVRMLHEIKLSVVNVVSDMTGFIQNIFGYLEGDNISADDNGSNKSIFSEMALGASFMGLSVLVAMVVLLKRA